MATGGARGMGAPPVENIAGPEEVTTKTKIYDWDAPVPTVCAICEGAGGVCCTETIEQRNERIWRAIKTAAGG